MLGWNEEIKKDLKYCGENVFIGHNVLFNNPENLIIHSNVRIDPNVMIMCPDTEIGPYTQICSFAFLGGRGQIKLNGCNFIGYHSQLFTATEDYGGKHGLVNDFFFENKVDVGLIEFKRGAGIASSVTVLPHTTLPVGTCVGAQSFVYNSYYRDDANNLSKLRPYSIYYGNPLKFKCLRDAETVEKLLKKYE